MHKTDGRQADGLRSGLCREESLDLCQHDRQVPQWVALQGRGNSSSLVIVEMVRKVRFEMWMMGGIVPTEQCIAAAEQLVSIACVTRVVVEPDLKGQRWGDHCPHLDSKGVWPVDFQVGDVGIVCDGGRLQKP